MPNHIYHCLYIQFCVYLLMYVLKKYIYIIVDLIKVI